MPYLPKRLSTTFGNLREFRLITFLLLVSLLVNGFLSLCLGLYPPSVAVSQGNRQNSVTHCCGPGCRQSLNEAASEVTDHYDNHYFQWQTRLGREKAASRNWNEFFETKPTDTVADLGAGGGHILATLNVSRRIAVEINPVARASIHSNYPEQIETFTYPEDVPDHTVDIFFSTSAIEHFECPLTELREMTRKVRKGGRVIIGIKNEGVQYAGSVKKDNIDQHLYTWNRQLLFNLLQTAGLHVTSVDPHISKVIKTGIEWTHPDNFTTYKTFIYHWARAIKKN